MFHDAVRARVSSLAAWWSAARPPPPPAPHQTFNLRDMEKAVVGVGKGARTTELSTVLPL
ncbi:hypothetical protein JYU34_013986 [Plutella xylostella]|uniref:Uncharacterized protein n=1 Tax=Plutella xylostella TaxID=51655 RepID=A0ABQ7Q8T7_PLUXY|nr:hypothetical protein JYU34_013986 [Plutella xylostella]